MDFFTETLQIRREWKIQRAKKQTNPINQENCIQQNYASKVNEKYFLKQKLRAFVALQKKKKMVSLKNIYLAVSGGS